MKQRLLRPSHQWSLSGGESERLGLPHFGDGFYHKGTEGADLERQVLAAHVHETEHRLAERKLREYRRFLNTGSSNKMAGNGARPMPAATAFATPKAVR